MTEDGSRAVTLSRLTTLVTFAEEGSVVGASQRLVVSESAVSMAISALSRDLGLPLVERVGRGVELTPAGSTYVGYARRILGLLEQGWAAARGVAVPGRGRLRLAAVTTAADELIAPLLASFSSGYPDVELRLDVGSSSEVWDLLAHHEVDLVLAGRPPESASGRIAAQRDNLLVVVARPDAVAAFAEGQTTWLLRERGSGTRAALEALLSSRDLDPPRMVLGSNGAVVAAAVAGLGAALVSADAVAAELAADKLAVVPLEGTPLVRPWHLVTGMTPTAATRLFVEHVLSVSGWRADRGPAALAASP
ncbi:MAG: LysR substrate-binding domain-containing protein [Actinomycetota bacterium]|nr:LysR substrate-binding domain-containing protein [Actinomycetota bacterium]